MKIFYKWSMVAMLVVTILAVIVAYSAVTQGGGSTRSIASMSMPAIAQTAFDDVARTDYLNVIDNAGFTAYINVGQQLEPSLISGSLKNVAFSGDDHIGGNMLITGYNADRIRMQVESREVQVFIHRSGWILVYLTRFQDPVLAIDWIHYGTNRLTETTLSFMLKSLLDVYQLDNAGTIQYYDFAHPDANNFMILGTTINTTGPTTSEMTITVPDSITLHHMGVSLALINDHRPIRAFTNDLHCRIDDETVISLRDENATPETHIQHTSYDRLDTFYNFEHTFTASLSRSSSYARCGMILVYEES